MGYGNEQSRRDELIQRITRSVLEKPGLFYPPGSNEFSLSKASVALILCPGRTDKEIEMLFVKRKVREGDPWSGQMALPGGRFSEADKDLLGTVIREVVEETGIDLSESLIFGPLDEIVSSNFLIRVTPYVAILKGEKEPHLKINTLEIDDYVWIPLSYFMDKKNTSNYLIERAGEKRNVPSYKFSDEHIIWGMTLRIVQDLVLRIQ